MTATYLVITFAGLIVPVVMTGFLADHLSQVELPSEAKMLTAVFRQDTLADEAAPGYVLQEDGSKIILESS